MLPLYDSGSADPVMLTLMQSSSINDLVGPLGPVGTLHAGEDGPGLCPIGLTVGLLPVAAVPLPAVWDPMIALSPVEGLVEGRRGEHCCTRWLVWFGCY